jgi:ribosomal protein L4
MKKYEDSIDLKNIIRTTKSTKELVKIFNELGLGLSSSEQAEVDRIIAESKDLLDYLKDK